MESELDEVRWCTKNIKLLLSLYRDRIADFHDRKQKKKSVWQKICNDMLIHGRMECKPDQLDRKFRNLKRTYKQIKTKKMGTGVGATKWEFYDEMEAILSDNLAVKEEEWFDKHFTYIACSEEEDTQSDYSGIEDEGCSSQLLDDSNSSTSMYSTVNSNKRKRVATPERRRNYAKKVENYEEALQTERFNKIMSAIEKSNKLQIRCNELLEKILAKNSNSNKCAHLK